MRGFKFLSIFEPLLYFFFSLAFSFAAARHYKHKNTLMTLMIMDNHPARELLLKVTRDFPDIWKKINVLLEEKENIGWPDWCFLPIDAWIALADYAKGEPNAYHADSFDMGKEIALIKLANTFAALGTWRMTQGIYRFDSTLYAELISTPITGEIPIEVLFNLPEWCVYVETPNLKYNELALQGFWAFLAFDHKQRRKELRFLLLTNDFQTIPSILHLDEKNLERAIAAVHKGSAKKVEGFGINRGIYLSARKAPPFRAGMDSANSVAVHNIVII